MLPEIKTYIEESVKLFDSIPEERKTTLKKVSDFIQTKQNKGEKAEIIYVCTHNSRRSLFGQIWGKAAAAYYGIEQVGTHSAGTEATAFNPKAIRALAQAGFRIHEDSGDKNPKYSVFYSETSDPIIGFSKTYQDPLIPGKNLCAIMTCSEADDRCPSIPGTELRISCSYEDPKRFDRTPQEAEKYLERCRQIGIENLYLFSLINTT